MKYRSENWEQVDDDDVPDSFRDPRLVDFRTVCSEGFECDMTSLSGVFLHKPHRRPECYKNGPDADCTCTIVVLRRVHEAHPAEDLTPEGIQLVIPGAERVAPASQKQLDLF